ncbi:MAG TPA: hypothetical protein VHR72_08045, partial [Gemmataceae bacterium]|nr:hypothetical protein [Gemmataceae bacterium]
NSKGSTPMRTYIAACCITMIALASAAFGAPNGSPGQSHNKSSAIQNVKSVAKSQANHQNSPKFTMNKFTANKKIDPALKLTKFKSPNKVANYNLKFGKTFAFGTYYQGKHHHHWTSYGWWSRFGCYVYWDPYVSCYYYWSDANQCYYPIAYADTVAPTANAPLIDIDNGDTTPATTPAPIAAQTSGNVGMPEPPLE